MLRFVTPPDVSSNFTMPTEPQEEAIIGGRMTVSADHRVLVYCRHPRTHRALRTEGGGHDNRDSVGATRVVTARHRCPAGRAAWPGQSRLGPPSLPDGPRLLHNSRPLGLIPVALADERGRPPLAPRFSVMSARCITPSVGTLVSTRRDASVVQ